MLVHLFIGLHGQVLVGRAGNIAEGYGRFHYKENMNFCYYSCGSILETKGWLRKVAGRNLSKPETVDPLIEKLDIIHRKLNGYMKFIGQSSPNRH